MMGNIEENMDNIKGELQVPIQTVEDQEFGEIEDPRSVLYKSTFREYIQFVGNEFIEKNGVTKEEMDDFLERQMLAGKDYRRISPEITAMMLVDIMKSRLGKPPDDQFKEDMYHPDVLDYDEKIQQMFGANNVVFEDIKEAGKKIGIDVDEVGWSDIPPSKKRELVGEIFRDILEFPMREERKEIFTGEKEG
ncbi:hypothetical protein KJ855_03585, partial [Patescibacteria group bacterium]|nr:hypothetical protein [Patescibacteria group bacterium]